MILERKLHTQVPKHKGLTNCLTLSVKPHILHMSSFFPTLTLLCSVQAGITQDTFKLSSSSPKQVAWVLVYLNRLLRKEANPTWVHLNSNDDLVPHLPLQRPCGDTALPVPYVSNVNSFIYIYIYIYTYKVIYRNNLCIQILVELNMEEETMLTWRKVYKSTSNKFRFRVGSGWRLYHA